MQGPNRAPPPQLAHHTNNNSTIWGEGFSSPDTDLVRLWLGGLGLGGAAAAVVPLRQLLLTSDAHLDGQGVSQTLGGSSLPAGKERWLEPSGIPADCRRLCESEQNLNLVCLKLSHNFEDHITFDSSYKNKKHIQCTGSSLGGINCP